MREHPQKTLGGFDVLAVRDYKAGIRKDLVTEEVVPTALPTSGVKGNSMEDSKYKLERLKNAFV